MQNMKLDVVPMVARHTDGQQTCVALSMCQAAQPLHNAMNDMLSAAIF